MAFEVEYFTLDTTQATNRRVFLVEGVPVDATNVVMDLIGGTAQAYSGDFAVIDATTVTWDNPSYNLYNQLATDDKIRVIYDRS